MFAESALPLGLAEPRQLLAVLVGLLILLGAATLALLRRSRQLEVSRKALNAALAERSPVLSALPDLVWVKDRDGVFLSCNPAFSRLFNTADAEIVGKTDFDCLETAQARRWRRLDRAAIENGTARHDEEWVTFADDGHCALLRITRIPMYDDDGRLVGVLGIGRDITGEHKAESALRQRESYQRALLDNFPFLVWLKDTEGRFLAVNQQFARAAGVADPRKLVDRTDQDVWPADLANAYRAADRSVMTTRRKLEAVERQACDGDGDRWLETYRAPVCDDQGKLLGTVGFARDVTERVRAEAALARERDLFSSGPVVLFAWSVQEGWPVRHVSENVTAVLGYTPAELTAPGFRFSSLIHPDDLERVGSEVRLHLDGGVDQFELSYRLRHKNDGYTWFHDFTRVSRDPQGSVETIHGYLFDQTRIKQLELSLADERNRLTCVIEGTRVGTWEWNVQTGQTRFNERWAQIIGYTLDELGPISIETWMRLAHPDDLELSGALLQRHFSGELPYYECEARMRHKDGHWVWVLDRGRVFEWTEAGEPLWMAGTHQEITSRKLAGETLRLAAKVFAHAHEAIMITDEAGNIVDVNGAFTVITGYEHAEVVGRNPSILKSGHHDHDFYEALWRDLETRDYWKGEIWNRRKNGEIYAELLAISAVRDGGRVKNYVALFSDITAQKERQQQLELIAFYDPLTNLPNRVLLGDRLQHAMAQAQRRGTWLAVVYLDLDGFKQVNDIHGHEAGDRLLIDIAGRLKQALREQDTVARLGGDEFVAVLTDLPDTAACMDLLPRLLSAAAQPLTLNDRRWQVSASLGVTLYPQPDKVDADQLLRQADQAMYQAKVAGKNRYHLFDTEQDRSIRGQAEILEQLRLALAADEFELYYQPKVNMRSGEVVGAEALIRWPLPHGGMRMPGEFLPYIENHALAISLDEWVIDRALTQIGAWHAAGLHVAVSVNVSAYHLQQADFVERLQTLLDRHPEVDPGCLVIEVLETTALMDVVRVSEVIRAAQEIGVMFALDDFGTGYSSLNYLRNLPARQIKIDRSFVRNMLSNRDDLAILEGIIGLAAAFSREPVAEGVESVEHGEFLLQLGCELAQGFGIAKPMPADALADWIAGWRPYPSWQVQRVIGRDELPVMFAMVEHRAWVASVDTWLASTPGSMPTPGEGRCGFAEWALGEGGARFGRHPAFPAILALHRQVHALTDDLLGLQQAGRIEEAHGRVHRLHVLGDELIAQLKLLLHEQPRAVRQISS